MWIQFRFITLHVPQDRSQALVNTVMNLWVHKRPGKFFTNRITIIFSKNRRTALHEASSIALINMGDRRLHCNTKPACRHVIATAKRSQYLHRYERKLCCLFKLLFNSACGTVIRPARNINMPEKLQTHQGISNFLVVFVVPLQSKVNACSFERDFSAAQTWQRSCRCVTALPKAKRIAVQVHIFGQGFPSWLVHTQIMYRQHFASQCPALLEVLPLCVI
jgi:hypothetical protein